MENGDLMPCPKCKKPIAEDAVGCPGCGKRDPHKYWERKAADERRSAQRSQRLGILGKLALLAVILICLVIAYAHWRNDRFSRQPNFGSATNQLSQYG